MTPSFENLPKDRDLSMIAAAVRDIVAALHASKWSYEHIAHCVERRVRRPVKATAIRAFLRRQGNLYYKAGNATLSALYDYVVSAPDTFPEMVRQKVAVHSKSLLGGTSLEQAESLLACSLTADFQNWLEVPDKAIADLVDKLCGAEETKYAVLRRSLNDGHFVNSHLVLRRHKEQRGLISAVHYQRDREDEERVSRGVLIPVVNNIYGLFKVERGEALEFLSLRNPVQQKFERMVGFLNGVALDREIICAGIVLKRFEGFWSRLPGRFRLDDLDLDEKDLKDLKREIKQLGEVAKAKANFLEPGEDRTVPAARVMALSCPVA